VASIERLDQRAYRSPGGKHQTTRSEGLSIHRWKASEGLSACDVVNIKMARSDRPGAQDVVPYRFCSMELSHIPIVAVIMAATATAFRMDVATLMISKWNTGYRVAVIPILTAFSTVFLIKYPHPIVITFLVKQTVIP
jgi:hypothetical protein